MLPKVPEWKCKPWMTKYPTKTKVSLYYQDPIECIQSLMFSLLLKDHIHFTPLWVFDTAAKTMHIYNEWRMGDTAWSMQV